MTVETRPGFIESAVKDNSPLALQQEENFQPQFIQGKKDIVRDLIWSNPVELFNDGVSLQRDFMQGIVEYGQLLIDPIYWGQEKGAPRGDGSKVFVLGGFATFPWMYRDTVKALKRNGYDAVALPWGINIKPIKQVAHEWLPKIWKEAKNSGHKVKLIGHSLGGFDWAAMFLENPDMFMESVDHVVFDASPRPTKVNKALAFAYLITQWFVEDNDFEVGNKAELLKEAQNDGLINGTSVDSSDDPILQGQFLLRDQDHFVIDHASHSALAANPDFVEIAVYRFAGQEVPYNPRIRQGRKPA